MKTKVRESKSEFRLSSERKWIGCAFFVVLLLVATTSARDTHSFRVGGASVRNGLPVLSEGGFSHYLLWVEVPEAFHYASFHRISAIAFSGGNSSFNSGFESINYKPFKKGIKRNVPIFLLGHSLLN